MATHECRRCNGSLRKLEVIIVFVFVMMFDTIVLVKAQNSTDSTRTSPRTDPNEARALNTLFSQSQWQISWILSEWNITGDVCSGTAVDASSINNPGIKCNCSNSHNTTCHVTAFLMHKPMSLLIMCCTFVSLGVIGASVQAQHTTDPSEARALNTMFSRWGISATSRWNISGELCSGTAIDGIPSLDYEAGIECDCSYSGNTTCHITALRAVGLLIQGELPDELWNLTYLTRLSLAMNNLTGSIPASIRNLNRMEGMNLSRNALSGELPRELGLLANLTYLAFSTNNFSGPLPWELGNLSRLSFLYFHGSGVSGPIPQTFSNLGSLERIWAADNELTGQIPDFIGNLSHLSSLRFQGNSFQGPIPTSLAGLLSLSDLRISDLSHGSFSLDFLKNMSSLSTIVLRNNNISGAIPSFFSEFPSLYLLDLSFNHLSGTVPGIIFSNPSLSHVFLGNNMLTGVLPIQKGPNLQTVDLSYNQLSGSFPFWVRELNLQINLVANNFTFNNINNSGLPSGLDCLQRNFQCNQGSPIYSSFAINCGGPQITSSDNVVYERDLTLGPASYYVSSSGRWAVGNAGLVIDSSNPQYQISSSLQVNNTSDPKLFQTSRVSAGSLRYYGLRLENGNYTVRLQFAEMVIGVLSPDRTWGGHGRRVFDIYIQGILAIRDFDVRREAGGISLKAVVREFKAHVRDNYLEIHLFWAGKGTWGIPFLSTYGPTISAIRVTPDFIPTVMSLRKKTKKTDQIVGIVAALGVACFFALVTFYYVGQQRNRQKNLNEEFLGFDARTYTYTELRAATDNFNPANKLGEGGFGPVYKGTLEDGRLVAVKQLSVESHHGKSQFIAEIATILAVQHRNLIKLYGCCIEGVHRLLVYEYLENKSLDQLLFGNEENSLCLDWPKRYDICLGVARGLAYLHEESRVRIVHRDVKASNILLDSNFTPKISDFGLAKLYDENQTHIITKVAGTRGYLAPEYAMLGRLTEKADIFSFGVVALELISGRSNTDSTLQDDKIYLLEWAWNLYENEREEELVDPRLDEFDEVLVRRIIAIGLLCTQASPGSRPSMSRVVGMITGDIDVAPVSSGPGYLSSWRFADETLLNEIGSSNRRDNARNVGGTTIVTDPDISLTDVGR